MKFLLDHNLPPLWAPALTELSKNEIPRVDVMALRSKFSPSTADHEWIAALAQERDWCVISQDRFGKGDLERAALRRSGLVVFRLQKQWASQSYWAKTHSIVRWWPRILEQSGLLSDGLVDVPFAFGARGKFSISAHR